MSREAEAELRREVAELHAKIERVGMTGGGALAELAARVAALEARFDPARIAAAERAAAEEAIRRELAAEAVAAERAAAEEAIRRELAAEAVAAELDGAGLGPVRSVSVGGQTVEV